ncbi:hypothetical protein [Ectopseudomonas composti]|uniref:hypothetical protein n=1 Tax=Ectopseudomonas composti TaxID=658457 RepID=UPI000774D55C|nr:hypothetical protein [Pseudomonas composti]
MTNVTPLNVKPDRLANQLAMHESMMDGLRQVLEKYRDMELMQIFINDAFAEISSEASMGPLVMIMDGDEPA